MRWADGSRSRDAGVWTVPATAEPEAPDAAVWTCPGDSRVGKGAGPPGVHPWAVEAAGAGGWSASRGLRDCRTGDPASGTGRPKRPPARRPLRMWFGTGCTGMKLVLPPKAGQGSSHTRRPTAVKARLTGMTWLRSPFYPSQRDHCGESDLPARGAKGRHLGRHLCPPPWRTSGEKGGVALTTSTPLVRRAVAPSEGGDTRGAASLRFSAADAGNPCCPASGAAFQGRPPPQRRGGSPAERKALCVAGSPPC